MPDIRKNGDTSNTVRFLLTDTSTGAKKTGLTSASSGLIISTVCDNESSATAYTVAGSTIETISTLGTFATPTTNKCRFKEVDATNHPGLYEFQFANARFAVSSAKRLIITVSGAANGDYEIEFTPSVDLDTIKTNPVVNGGTFTFPANATGASTTNITAGTITTATSVTNGVNVTSWNSVALSTTNPLPNAAAGASGGLHINGSNSGTTTFGALTVTGATTLTGAVSLGSTLGITGAVTLSSTLTTGAVTFSNLTINTVQFGAYFPTNFASMTVDGVTGYVSADVRNWRGTAVSVPTVAGVPNVNVKTINDVATTSVATVGAYIGSASAGATATALASTDTNLSSLITTVGSAGAGLTAIPKTGYKLASDGLDSVATTAPSGVASNFREMVVQVWRRFFKKSTLTSTQLKTYADDGTTVVTTQTVSDDGITQTQGVSS